jgi:hypothetical protein
MEMNVEKKLGNENLKTIIPNTHYDITEMAQDGIIWVA